MKKSMRDLFRWGGLSGILLGLIGFSTACTLGKMMYGPGPDVFSVKIKVTDQASQPIKDVEVKLYKGVNRINAHEIYTTNNLGLAFSIVEYPVDTLRFRFEDMDGAKNGGRFADTTVTVLIAPSATMLDYTIKMRKIADEQK